MFLSQISWDDGNSEKEDEEAVGDAFQLDDDLGRKCCFYRQKIDLSDDAAPAPDSVPAQPEPKIEAEMAEKEDAKPIEKESEVVSRLSKQNEEYVKEVRAEIMNVIRSWMN